MALSPQEIRDATFRSVKRGGFDPEEVSAFKSAAADALQQAIQDGTAMEARARAAVARLQELSQQQAAETAQQAAGAEAGQPASDAEAGAEAPPAEAPARREATVDESETISRTLLLAQRTADTTVAEAEAQAAAKISSAEAQAESTISSAEAEAAGIIESAKAESRKAGEAERVRVEGEVQALLARRDFLESDVEQLEQHLGAQRERITEVVAQLESLTNGSTNGLAPLRRPQLSASNQSSSSTGSDDSGDSGDSDDPDDGEPDVAALIDEVVETADSGGDELGEIAKVAGTEGDDGSPASDGRHSLFDNES